MFNLTSVECKLLGYFLIGLPMMLSLSRMLKLRYLCFRASPSLSPRFHQSLRGENYRFAFGENDRVGFGFTLEVSSTSLCEHQAMHYSHLSLNEWHITSIQLPLRSFS